MKKKLSFIIFLSIEICLLSYQVTMAQSQSTVVDKFIEALMKRDEKLMQSYVIEPIKIPELKESENIYKITEVPSIREDTKLLVAYFKEKHHENRTAFIWEVVSKGEKISNLKVLYDGTNPFMEEAKIVKEYEMKFKTKVLVPTQFPYDVIRFDGLIHDEYLVLHYSNESIHGGLNVRVSPISSKLEEYKKKRDTFYTLKNGEKAIFSEHYGLGYELRFQKDGFHYTIAIGNKKYLKKKYTVNDLIRIAESMQ
jgi:hypothetical protein